MAESFTIAEVSRLTGLASHTLRYYEQQFPALLDINRTRGGHRIYLRRHLEALDSIMKLLKDEKVSIRRAREILGEASSEAVARCMLRPMLCRQPVKPAISVDFLFRFFSASIQYAENNDNRDRLLENVLRLQPREQRDELLDQISRCRHETRETIKLCQLVMRQRINSGQEFCR
jgi:DNA-binding transcriptional MerR regulator